MIEKYSYANEITKILSEHNLILEEEKIRFNNYVIETEFN